MLDFTLLTPALSNKRGSLALLQLIVFIMQKSCVDTYALSGNMDSIKLSSKGQVIIPKHIRSAYHWERGQELILIDTGNGILLKPKAPFSESKLSEVAGCLHYAGIAKTVDEMDRAIAEGLKAQFNDCD